MKKSEIRREILLGELHKEGRLTIEEVQDLLGISASTARRLIVELEQENCLIRCFGGIQKIQPAQWKYSYEETQDMHADTKARIGEYAAKLVEEGDVIYLSGGSTVKYMALALSRRLESGGLKNISVITNSLVSAEVLTGHTDVIMPGGVYRRTLQVLDGGLTEKNLRSMCFTKAFLGVVAVSESEGFMTSDLATNSVIEVILSRASSFYVLADSSKFGRNSLISYGFVKEAARIVTDNELPLSVKNAMVNKGAVIYTV